MAIEIQSFLSILGDGYVQLLIFVSKENSIKKGTAYLTPDLNMCVCTKLPGLVTRDLYGPVGLESWREREIEKPFSLLNVFLFLLSVDFRFNFCK